MSAAAAGPAVRDALEHLYSAFNAPESALDPVQIVRRYARHDDREVVAFIAAGLAFGRVASVMASIEALCAALGRHPAEAIRSFDPARDRARFDALGHRWTRGRDLAALVWMLGRILDTSGSVERFFGTDRDPQAVDVGSALESFSTRARAIDLRPVYGRRVGTPGAWYFFSRPSSGSACKRLNLFLRWMVRHDQVDPGGWTSVPARQLVVPLDTHTIRVGRCLRLTRRVSPGWRMATDITAALRVLDPDDPVRFDFSLCHLSMLGACGYASAQGDTQCPLRGYCRPARTRAKKPEGRGQREEVRRTKMERERR
jgi:uncharacterized protein (TIGR02757 family)